MTDPTYQPPAEDLLEHASFLRALTRSLLKQGDRAEDAVQETWLKALTQPPRGPTGLRSWLGRVARNFSLMAVRGEKRRANREQATRPRRRIPTPEEAAGQLETQRIVVEAVQSLDEPYRETIVLAFFEGLTAAEIARARDIPEGTVRTRIRRALATLRGRLDRRYGDRKTWCAALLPLLGGAGAEGAAAAGTALGGGVVMGGKKIAWVVASALLVAGIVTVLNLSSEPNGARPDRPDLLTRSGDPDAARAEDTGPSTAVVANAGAVRGIASRRGSPVSARIEVHRIAHLDPRGLLRRPVRLDTERLLESPITRGPVAGRGESGEDGLFEVGNLPPGDYRVLARTADGATGAATFRVMLPGEITEVHVVVPGGGKTLRGRAVWSDGRPFTGLVSAYPASDTSGLCTPQVFLAAGSDGSFLFENLEPGLAGLAFVQRGRLLAMGATVRLPRKDVVTFVVDEGVRTISGTVLSDAGSPVEGAEVTAHSNREIYHPVVERVRTGGDGTFRLAATGDSTMLVVDARGFLSWRRQLLAEHRTADVRLTPSPVLRGRVLRSDGEAVGGVPVYAALAGHSWFHAEHTVADDAGRYRFARLPGLRIMLFAHGDGLVSRGLSEVRSGGANPVHLALDPGEKAEFDLTVVPAASAEGTVRDADGGIAGAPVFANLDLPYPTNWYPSWMPGLSRAVTDAEGRYRIDTLIPGVPYKFRAEPAQRVPAEAGPILIEGGASASVDIEIAPLRALRVTVTVKETGDPVTGALVEVMYATGHGGYSGMRRAWVTGPDGTVDCCPVPAGGLAVIVAHRDLVYGGMWPVKVSGSEGSANNVSVACALERGKPISGVVRCEDGSPYHPGWVCPMPVDRGPQSYSGFGRVEIAEDGAFVVPRVPEGRYRLQVGSASESRTHMGPVVLPGDENVAVVVGRAVRPEPDEGVRVEVIGPEGEPVPSGAIRFHVLREFASTHIGRTVNGTLADGVGRPFSRFTWVELWVEVPSARSASGVLLGGRVAGPFTPEDGPIVLRLSEAVALEGRVTGPGGEPVHGVLVAALPDLPATPQGKFTAKEHGSALSDGTGRFRIEGLSTMSYRLEPRPPAGFISAEPVTSRGGRTGVVIRLGAGISPVITVLDPQGRPVSGARVFSHPGEAPLRMTPLSAPRTGTDGRAVLDSLDLATSRVLKIEPPYDRKDLFPAEIRDWSPADTTLRLERAYTIAGRVLDPRGNPALGARVQLWPRDKEPGDWTGRPVSNDGTFEIRRLTAGPKRIRVRPAGGFAGDAPPWMTVEAGTVDLELTTELRHTLIVRNETWPEAVMGYPELAPDDRSKFRNFHYESPRVEGTARFLGLIPGRTYSFRVVDRKLGIGAFLKGIPADAGEVRVRMEPTSSIIGRVHIPEGARATSVHVVWGGFLFGTRPEPDGTFEIKGIPDDAVVVRATAISVNDEELAGEVRARAGKSVEVKLEAR